MDRQLIIHPQGEHYHVVFHNYMGPFEGRQIGKWLDLEEIETPPDEVGPKALKPNQFYLWHAMERHPDLHALLPAGRLEEVAKAVDHFHVRIVEGAELVPELPPEKLEPHEDVNYREYLGHQHDPAWKRGPKTVVGAFLMRAIPVALLAAIVFIASRHLGDHRSQVQLDQAFSMASAPRVEQSALSAIVSPDYSNQLRTEIRGVRFVDGNRVLLNDGTLIRFAGIGDVREVLERARDTASVPVMELDVGGGRVTVAGIAVGDHVFGRGAQLIHEGKLAPSHEPPPRSYAGDDTGWWKVNNIPVNPDGSLGDVLGRRLSVPGTIIADGGRYRFVGQEGASLDLELADVASMGEILDRFGDGNTEIRADFVVVESYPEDRRSLTGPVGSARLHCLSLQNYHVVAGL